MNLLNKRGVLLVLVIVIISSVGVFGDINVQKVIDDMGYNTAYTPPSCSYYNGFCLHCVKTKPNDDMVYHTDCSANIIRPANAKQVKTIFDEYAIANHLNYNDYKDDISIYPKEANDWCIFQHGWSFGYCIKCDNGFDKKIVNQIEQCCGERNTWVGQKGCCMSNLKKTPENYCCYDGQIWDSSVRECIAKKPCEDKTSYKWCKTTETCEGTDRTYRASDSNTYPGQVCCEGTCKIGDLSKTCGDQNGYICPDTKECLQGFISAKDTERCCPVECTTPHIVKKTITAPDEITLAVGETATLTATLTEDGAPAKEVYVSFRLSNTKYVEIEISETGLSKTVSTFDRDWASIKLKATDTPGTATLTISAPGFKTLDNKDEITVNIKVQKSCPKEIGTRNAGCVDLSTVSAKYGEQVSGTSCTIACWQCIEGAEWNGNDCVGSKSDWNNNKGVCKDTQKCYCKHSEECKKESFDQGKTKDSDENPQNKEEGKGEGLCVDKDQYTDDHYCDSGTWTTRTKFMAQAVLNAGSYSNYILYCGEVGTNNRQTCILKSDHNLIIGALLNKGETPKEYFDNDFFAGKNTHIKDSELQNPGIFNNLYLGNDLLNYINMKTIIGHDQTKNIILFSNNKEAYTSVSYITVLANIFDKIKSYIQNFNNIKYLFLKKNSKDIQVINRIKDLAAYYNGENKYITSFSERDAHWNKLNVFSTNLNCMDKDYQFRQTPIPIENEFLPGEELITEGCCLATQCWNGKACTDDKENANIKGKNYICVDGDWLDSKTAIIAEKLLDFVSGDYVLHCDKYDEILRNPDDVKDVIDIYEPNGCVLRYGDNLNEIALGISIEENKNSGFLSKIGESCSKTGDENKFLKCNNKLWFNPLINSYIYNKNEIALEGTISLQNVIDFFKNLFDRLFGTEQELTSVKLYKSEINGKEIEGFKKENNFIINYKGFGNLCSKIQGDCYYNSNEDKTVVTSTNMNKWKDLTVKIRVKTSN